MKLSTHQGFVGMAHPDKKSDTPSGEWAKHLRPWGKRVFNKKVRKKIKAVSKTK
jgi:hypothetical protein